MSDIAEQEQIRIRARARARVAAQNEDSGNISVPEAPPTNWGRMGATTAGGIIGGLLALPAAAAAAGPTLGIGSVAAEAGGMGLGAGIGGQAYDFMAELMRDKEATPAPNKPYFRAAEEAAADVVGNAAMAPGTRGLAAGGTAAMPFLKGTKAIPVVEPYVRPALDAAGNVISATTKAVTGAGQKVFHSGPVQYVLKSDEAKAAADQLRQRTLASVQSGTQAGEQDVATALRQAREARNAPITTTPALSQRLEQYNLAGSEEIANLAKKAKAENEAALLQELENKRVIAPVGTPKTLEQIGTPVQAEISATKEAEKKAASKAWTDTTAAVDKVDADKRASGEYITSLPEFNAFMARVDAAAKRAVGDPKRRAFFNEIKGWFPKKNLAEVKASDVMELKRRLGMSFSDTESTGYKAIQEHEEQDLFNELDGILDKHLTDTSTGARPYAERNADYSDAKDALTRYNTKYGKRYTSTEPSSGEAISSPTDVAKTLVSDPAAIRAALKGGASVKTIEDAMSSHIANEFEGKSTQDIVNMTRAKTPLRNTLDNVPELSDLNRKMQSYVQERMDADLNNTTIGGFKATAQEAGTKAEQAAKAKVTASGRIAQGQETRKKLLERQYDKAMGTATTHQENLMKLQALEDSLNAPGVVNNPSEIITVAKKHFSDLGDTAALTEIDKIEKTVKSAADRTKAVKNLAIYGGAYLGFNKAQHGGFIP
jgi:hypothetical protein